MTPHEQRLQRYWNHLWRRLGVRHEHDAHLRACFRELLALYGDPGRHYHDAAHIVEGLDELHKDVVWRSARDPDAIALAFIYHDTIIDILSKINELQSARLMMRHTESLPISAIFRERVFANIMATCHGGPRLVDNDQQIVSDLDLMRMAYPERRFAELSKAVRDEYARIPTHKYLARRKEIFEGFLRRPSIFYRHRFRKRYELVAQQNLARVVSQINPEL